MAKIKQLTEEVTKTVTVEETAFHLTLNKEEAQTLYDLLGHTILGGGERREHTAAIWLELERMADKGYLVEKLDIPSDMKGYVEIVNPHD